MGGQAVAHCSLKGQGGQVQSTYCLLQTKAIKNELEENLSVYLSGTSATIDGASSPGNI